MDQRPSFDETMDEEWDERFRKYEEDLEEQHTLETVLRAQAALEDLQDAVRANVNMTEMEKQELIAEHGVAWNKLGDLVDDLRNLLGDGDRAIADGQRAEILLERLVWNDRHAELAEHLLEDIMPGFAGHLDPGIKRRLRERLSERRPNDRAQAILSEEHADLYELSLIHI